MSTSRRLPEVGLILAILALAAAFRLWKIGSSPPALHYDEALNGRIARRITEGDLPSLIVQPGMRESLIFYLQAASLGLLGRTPGALRLPTALASVALVLGAMFVTRELFGRKVGLLASFICATTLWPTYLGRLGTRPVLLPAVLAFGLFAFLRAWHKERRSWWGLAGVLFGVAHYTYTPNVFVLPALLLTTLGLAVLRREAFRLHRTGMLATIGLSILVALPIWFVQMPNLAHTSSRPSVLSVFYAGQGLRDFVWTVVTQTYLVLRMFVLKGDLNIRHNIPGRPVFDVVMAVPFLVGLVAAWTRRHRWRALFCAGWLGVFLLPTFLSKDAPHFLRGSGILPVLFIWPAIGLHWAYKRLSRRAGRFVGVLATAALLTSSFVITVHDYVLSDFLQGGAVFEAFGGDDVALGFAINQRLHAGWTGENVRALPMPPVAARTVWVEPDLWDGDIYAQFLVPVAPGETPYFQYLSPGDLPSGGAEDLFVAPDRELYWTSRAPAGVTVSVLDGPPVAAPDDAKPGARFVVVSWNRKET